MAVTSPTSASPGLSLLEWDESAVHSWLTHIGLPQYEDLIYEHGITGDVLAVMEHLSLTDLGMTSIGHRLCLLRAVWELKLEQGLELGEEDWRPQDIPETQVQKGGEQIDRLWDVILDQHDRLMSLERDQARLLVTLQDRGIDIPASEVEQSHAERNNGVEIKATKQAVGRSGSLRWRDHGGRSDDEQETAPSRKAERRASMLFPTSLTSSVSTQAAPRSSDSATFKDSFTPTTSTANYPFDSPSNHLTANANANQGQKPSLTRLLSGSQIMGTSVSPPAHITTTPNIHSSVLATSTTSTKPPQALAPGPITTGPSPITQIVQSHSGPSDSDRSKAKDAAHSAAKSFRVTLEDPCWKVLPAALKKYKINDDWKMYALFICFGNTERCLSYDEKPLMLFQKLKESGQKPVFMLRHIRDIKSPITVAQQKQLAKLGLPAHSTASVLPKIKPASDTSTSPTKATTLQPNAPGRDGHDARGFPELPSPGLKDDGTKGGTVIDVDGKITSVTYAVAIYPYIADRQDEFDVAVGATFVIMSKAKGWYIVQKDPDGMGKIVPDQSKSGWVPAGCLLELSSAIAVSTPPVDLNITYPGLSPLSPNTIISSSYPGLVLMDYESKSSDELTLKEGEKVKVYKKYCHWSYTIQQETGKRGWVPAWFIGKIASSSGTPGTAGLLTASSGSGSLPTTATGQDVSTPRQEPSASSGSGGMNASTMGRGAVGEGDADDPLEDKL